MTSSEDPDEHAGTRLPSPERDGLPVVFGEVLFDHFPDGNRVLGGAPFNVAWHLAGFEMGPSFVSAVGDDEAGHAILERMEGWGLQTDGIQTDPDHPTGRVEVLDDEDGPGFEIPPDQAWDHIDADELRRARTTRPALVYHGTLALRDEASREALDALLEEHDPPVFVDMNLRDPWWSPELVERVVRRARWVKLNQEELAELTGRSIADAEACRRVARAFAEEHGVPRLIVTRGAEGALLVSDQRTTVEAAAPEVQDGVDTVGAGDAFSAVLIMGILSDWDRTVTLGRAVRFAADLCRVQGATTQDLTLYERHQRRWAGGPTGPARVGEWSKGLYVLSLSVHGLVRSEDIELGRDPDTGGQVSYVVDQARALGEHPEVDEVEVVTREVHGRKVDESYAEPFDAISDRARIVRLPFGPRRYLRKESLWPYLDGLLDQLTRHVRRKGRIPDVVHGHYADAGYVGAQLAKLLGVPFVFTGHSLGRVKKERLLSNGMSEEKIEDRYRITRRIEAEEHSLETAALVIASTRQEIEEQYARYDHYEPERKEVNPPGVDLARFSAPGPSWTAGPIADELERFLRDPGRPIVLTIARPDERKNFPALIDAFGGHPSLRDRANLVLIAGSRDDISDMPAGSKRVLRRILTDVDRHDLYGVAAYPKSHRSADIPDLYRMAARSGGVFVNPALTEPFGLTLIEAAASGVPIVATNDGGPRDIVETLDNGVLVDPEDPAEIGRAIEEALDDEERWSRWAGNGLERVDASFSWSSHADRYVREVRRILGGVRPARIPSHRSRLISLDRLLVADLDNTLTGDPEAIQAFAAALDRAGSATGFGVVTGRTIDYALAILEDLALPDPNVLITASGTGIRYGRRRVLDRSWERRIRYRWDPDAVRETLDAVGGLERGDPDRDTAYRIRYVTDPDAGHTLRSLRKVLRKAGLQVTTLFDDGRYLEVTPVRASPGLAVRYFCFKWDLPAERVLTAGDSGNDRDMLSGDTLGVVVGNHTEDLEPLRDNPRVYFAEGEHAWGVLEGVEWYDFFTSIEPDPGNPDD